MSHHTSKHPTTPSLRPVNPAARQATGPALAALVAAARTGCANAETDLYDQHLAMLTKVARRHGLDEHQCADVVQRSWLKARQGLDGLRRDDRFGPWLAAIARNESISMLRASAREVGFPDHDLADDRTASPDRHLVRAEEWAMLRAAMARLDPADRELVRLLFEEG
ncbi:MAG: sigma-70 family RNA polymerase sigma factor, partial [Actinomycetota bacterium]